MWGGLASLLAKLAAKQAAKKSKNVVRGMYWEDAMDAGTRRLPESLEFLRGYSKRTPMPSYLMKGDPALSPEKLKEALKNLPTHVDTIPTREAIRSGAGRIKNLFRGETLHPDQTLISKTGLESGKRPGQWWSVEPFEASDYAIRRSKIPGGWGAVNPIKPGQPWPLAMGEGIANPGVIRRMKINKNIEDLGGIKGAGTSHFHPTDKMIGESKISMFYSVINRLREMGWKDAQIFKYIGQIMKKKNVAGKRDWMLYNRGGMV